MPSICFSRTSSAMRSTIARLVHLIGNLGDDERFAILAHLLDIDLPRMTIEPRPVR